MFVKASELDLHHLSNPVHCYQGAFLFLLYFQRKKKTTTTYTTLAKALLSSREAASNALSPGPVPSLLPP